MKIIITILTTMFITICIICGIANVKIDKLKQDVKSMQEWNDRILHTQSKETIRHLKKEQCLIDSINKITSDSCIVIRKAGVWNIRATYIGLN